MKKWFLYYYIIHFDRNRLLKVENKIKYHCSLFQNRSEGLSNGGEINITYSKTTKLNHLALSALLLGLINLTFTVIISFWRSSY